ncbi:histamine H3 receptor [Gallus gallus]|uniref:histamine H3 receptor n=1 Tax=Gallus gallus TaxID=9031 RepID=UPI0000E81423|nr:histamine H3 receptor [Gallus gallus]XP_040543734.1 histamine H3 receptor [Gallus gallus]XP_040543735.1 histamine H3 receptor [Gallus gallus]XP_425705.4 histamine H3 receptor [Gallus gallus]|eukprot:XP_425705.4 histamine H3 receptor isoform X2 [Gallus gallus]
MLGAAAAGREGLHPGGAGGGAGPGRGGSPAAAERRWAMESGGELNGSAAASGRFATAGTAALGALMALLIAVTVAGNALVMLAFVADSSLRTQNNFFLLNLAISDFLVGAFCIPLYVPYVLTGRWIFGRSLCKLWLVVDYLLCTSSVFNIVLISYDRFLSVTRAVSYRAQQGNTRRAVLKMVLVWVLAFLLYGPAIISWEYISGESIIPTGECYAEFFYNWYFLMTASTLEFFTPFISVMFFNLSIYLNIQKRTKLRLDVFHEVHNRSFAEEMEMSPEAKLSSKCYKWEQKEPAETLGLSKSKAQAAASSAAEDLLTATAGGSQCCNKKGCKNSASALSLEKRVKVVSQGVTQRFRLSRDKKVAKSLAIIVGIFGICWAPYTLLMIIRAGCHGHCISDYWYETSFWLLWINSAVNPVLYPLCHYSFRRAFIKLLCPKKLKIQPHDPLQNCWK